jgi:hypothetical protein
MGCATADHGCARPTGTLAGPGGPGRSICRVVGTGTEPGAEALLDREAVPSSTRVAGPSKPRADVSIVATRSRRI